MSFDGIAVAAARLAKLLAVSERHVWAMDATGRLGPRPFRLGRAVRWRLAEVEAWIAAGAPPRDRWLAMQPPKGGAA